MGASKLVRVESIETIKIVLRTPEGDQTLLLDREDAYELHKLLGQTLKINLGY